jgi:glycopeptide antibiotics resistance protein
LSVNFKNTGFWRKLASILVFSLAAETAQFVFAIGASDITDLITNTFGGALGLLLYDLCNKHVNTKKLDRSIDLIGTILLILFVLLRVLFLNVRYRSAR